jgi:hypothetical protein
MNYNLIMNFGTINQLKKDSYSPVALKAPYSQLNRAV